MQAQSVGLPPPKVSEDNAEVKLRTEEFLLRGANSEEQAGLADAEMNTDQKLSEEQRNQMSQSVKEQTVGN